LRRIAQPLRRIARGCLDDVVQLLIDHHVELALQDLRVEGVPLPPNTGFEGELRGQQVNALNALALHDIGVLAATTAFGKTVVAAALIAHRARNTLILVHRQELLLQWVARLKAFLNIDPKNIGVIGGGRRKPTGIMDVALIQSLVRGGLWCKRCRPSNQRPGSRHWSRGEHCIPNL
jgi:superfamily II DNA or RNA helicase